MSTTTATNGKPARKQLADEIDRFDQQLGDRLDRLDSILDTLAEGLPGAVTDVCREGARQAVKDAIIEIVSNPELRALLAPTAPAPSTPVVADLPLEPSKPSLWQRLKAKLAAIRNAVTGATKKAKDAVVSRYQAAGDTVKAVGQATGEALNWKRVLWVGVGIGAVVGIACLVVPQGISAAISAVTATTTAVAVQTGTWLKRAARRFGLVS